MTFKNKILRFKLLLVLLIGVIVLSGFSYFLISNSQRSKAQFIDCVQGKSCVNNTQCGNTGYCNIFNPPSVAGKNQTGFANPPLLGIGSCMCGGVATPPAILTPVPIPEIQCDTTTCKGGSCACNQSLIRVDIQNKGAGTTPINCSKLTCNGINCLCTPLIPTQTPPTVCQSLVNSLSDVTPLKISTGGLSLNWGGLQEKWFQDKNNTWYYIYPYLGTPDGSTAVMKWDQNKGLKIRGKNTGTDVVKTPETKACYDAINVGYTFPKPNGTITPPQPTPTSAILSEGIVPCMLDPRKDFNPTVAVVCFINKGDAKRAPSTTDWIGIYKPGSADTQNPKDQNYIAWKYLTNTQQPGLVQNGQVTFENLSPGQYEARFFLDNGYQKVNTITVTVSSMRYDTQNKPAK